MRKFRGYGLFTADLWLFLFSPNPSQKEKIWPKRKKSHFYLDNFGNFSKLFVPIPHKEEKKIRNALIN